MVLLLGFLVACAALADDAEKRWWEKRREMRPELYFPHRAHEEAMEASGVTCLACHPFSTNQARDPRRAAALAEVANEPLKAICHSCHVEDRSGPARCRLCHPRPQAIWPSDHDFDYVRQHALDGALDENACRRCHLELADCVACHFRRDGGPGQVHRLGYRLSHGLEARLDPAGCGRCHNPSYCFDCHREIQR